MLTPGFKNTKIELSLKISVSNNAVAKKFEVKYLTLFDLLLVNC